MIVQKEIFGEGKHVEFKSEIPKKHEKFLKEKKELHARFVAERQSGYGIVAESGLEAANV